ncbi:MAG: metalloregulator ArsR/SmtB family transcription factor [Candidatus Heimdallarchaeota archaeon]|nr:metalloregulator ArsR/SmtB family transcription factor [Candidatus Heimdallarchaeota archaeon]
MNNRSSKQKIGKWLATQEKKVIRQEYLKEKKQKVTELQKQPEFKKQLELYSALGNEVRFTIFKLIEDSPLCTCVLAEILDLKESSVSYHLKILEQAGLIIGLKSGAFINYHTKKSILNELK